MANEKFPSKAPPKVLTDNEGPVPPPVEVSSTLSGDIKAQGVVRPSTVQDVPVETRTDEQYRGIVQQAKVRLLALLENNKGESRVPAEGVRQALNILGVPDSDHPGYTE